MSLAPRSVVDLGDDRLHLLIVSVEAVIKADRVHRVAEVPRLSQQPNLPGRTFIAGGLDEVPHGDVERRQVVDRSFRAFAETLLG